MSKILGKAFDATKKIFRSIFMGSPNLITAPDLNRQIEALKFQLDQLDDKVGVYSDFSVGYDFSGTTLTVTPDYSYLQFKGCSFQPELTPMSINLTESAPEAFLCLVADSELVTYDTDFSHDIAGAKFEDGTSMAAANQMVYKNERLVLSHTLLGLDNLVGILYYFIVDPTIEDVFTRNNCVDRFSSVLLKSNSNISLYQKGFKTDIKAGVSYDSAINSLDTITRGVTKLQTLYKSALKTIREEEGSAVAVTYTFNDDFVPQSNKMVAFSLVVSVSEGSIGFSSCLNGIFVFPTDIDTGVHLGYFTCVGSTGAAPDVSSAVPISSTFFVNYSKTSNAFTLVFNERFKRIISSSQLSLRYLS